MYNILQTEWMLSPQKKPVETEFHRKVFMISQVHSGKIRSRHQKKSCHFESTNCHFQNATGNPPMSDPKTPPVIQLFLPHEDFDWFVRSDWEEERTCHFNDYNFKICDSGCIHPEICTNQLIDLLETRFIYHHVCRWHATLFCVDKWIYIYN